MLQKGEMEVVPVVSKLITKISSIRVHCPDDLRPKDNRKTMLKIVKEVKKRFPEGPPLLNPIKDMNIKDAEFSDVVEKIEKLEKRYDVYFILPFTILLPRNYFNISNK